VQMPTLPQLLVLWPPHSLIPTSEKRSKKREWMPENLGWIKAREPMYMDSYKENNFPQNICHSQVWYWVRSKCAYSWRVKRI
jgi:hypothetical protein